MPKKPSISEGLGERLSWVRNELSRDEAAAMIGVGTTTWGAWERGQQSPNSAALASIASKLDVNLHWLVTGEGEPYGPVVVASYRQDPDFSDAGKAVNTHDQIEDAAILENIAQMPRIKPHLSAGSGALLDDVNLLEDVFFQRDWLERQVSYTGTRNLATVEVRGDSMWPTISDGVDVVIDLNDRHITDGCIYAIRRENMLLVKRLQRLTNGLKLISDNQQYSPETLGEEEASRLDIIGRVRLVLMKI